MMVEQAERLHQKFPSINTQPSTPYGDEDFALEVTIPKSHKLETVEEECNGECIEIEDKYDVYILTKVVPE